MDLVDLHPTLLSLNYLTRLWYAYRGAQRVHEGGTQGANRYLPAVLGIGNEKILRCSSRDSVFLESRRQSTGL